MVSSTHTSDFWFSKALCAKRQFIDKNRIQVPKEENLCAMEKIARKIKWILISESWMILPQSHLIHTFV